LIKKVLIGCFFILAARDINAQQLDSLLNNLSVKYPQEKVYLHFDRPYYNAGETIWFKAYLTSGNLPSLISKTLYAELLDEKGNVLQRKTMPVIQSVAASNFDLPDSTPHTLLYVRAYTAWMLNFNSSLLFVKAIPIITPANVPKKIPTPDSYNLHFFPEGGDLVSGVSSRVAFKANNQNGVPFDISGDILDDKQNKIAAFISIHDGMGYFSFTPLPGKKYSAAWKDKKGIKHETPLPEAKKQGVVLSIDNTNNQLTYSLERPDSAEDAFTSYYVIAQMQEQLMYSARVNMTRKTIIHAPIPIDSFPDGILQVTVFNANQIPVAERIVFINHGNYYFNTDLHTVEKNLDKRGRNVLQIDVGGELKTNLSISVTDADLNPSSNNEENIFSSLLLSSDVRGYVYNPAYYFSSDEDSVKQQLDLVMMTNGWRRFKWEDIIAGNWPTIKYQPENYLSISGKIYGLSKNLLTDKTLTGFLKIKNAAPKIYIMPVSEEGDFKFDSLYFYDTARIYYQFNNDKDRSLTSSASFSFFNPFVSQQTLSGNLLPSLYNTYPDSNTIKKNRQALTFKIQNEFFQNGGKILDSVVLQKSRAKTPEEKMNDEYTSGFFSSNDARTFILENDPSAVAYQTVLSYLQGKVAGLQISIDGGGNATALWRGSNTSFYRDEFNTDINSVANISMSDVAMIKVFSPPFYGGFGGGTGGAVAIYTKKGGGNFSSIKGLDFSTVIGYSPVKEFYSPDYETDNSIQPDYRTTLYWNPFLLMDEKVRRVTIPFYNNDNCKKIKVTIEGMNEAGQLTREEKIFE
jgi:hypothetical protein